MTGPEIVQRVLSVATMSIETLAAETGISSATLYSWQAGRRNPSTENVRKLAEALRRRGGELVQLADELEADEG